MELFSFRLYQFIQFIILLKMLVRATVRNNEHVLSFSAAKGNDHTINKENQTAEFPQALSFKEEGTTIQDKDTASPPQIVHPRNDYLTKNDNKSTRPWKRSTKPQSITRFGRSADNKPTSLSTRYGRSIRPQSITRFGRSADIKPASHI